MCAVSNIGDTWGRDFETRYPEWTKPYRDTVTFPPYEHSDIEKLRREVEELKKLLRAAAEFDRATGQPDCQMDDKVALIRAVAAALGVDMSGVFPEKESG